MKKKVVAVMMVLILMTLIIAIPVQANVEVSGMQTFRKFFDSVGIQTWVPAHNCISAYITDEISGENTLLYSCLVRYNGTNYIVDWTGDTNVITYYKNKKAMLDWLEDNL